MLAEIYFLKLAAPKRIADDASRATTFVPLALSIVPQKIGAGASHRALHRHSNSLSSRRLPMRSFNHDVL